MKKRLLSIVLAICLAFSCAIFAFAYYKSNVDVVEYKTPVQGATLSFVRRFGYNYKNAPTPPVYYNGYVLVVSGKKLYKLDCISGDIVATSSLAGSSSFSAVSPLCVADTVFVQLDDIIQAFDFNTMKSKWIYRDSLGGQGISPIIYDNGYIYTGFWNNDVSYGNFVCLTAKDDNPSVTNEVKKPKWTYKSKGGFYWTEALIKGNYVILGTSDDDRGTEGKSKIISLNKNSGKVVSFLNTLGDIRSGVSYCAENDSYYTASKLGYIYKFKMQASNGKLYNLSKRKAFDSITATPVVYKKRLYIGGQKGSNGEIAVLNADNLSQIYSVITPGFPQAKPLVSTGYEKENGNIYVYFSYNKKPGGIVALQDKAGQTKPVLKEIYKPKNEYSEYSISTVASSDLGNLYFKNDSGCIFALEGKENIFNVIMPFLNYILKNILKLINIFN